MVWIAVLFFVLGSVSGAVLMSLCAAAGNDRGDPVLEKNRTGD